MRKLSENVEFKDEILKQILQKRLVIIGNPQCGKTNATMFLARSFMKKPDVRVFIFDSAINWMHRFDKIPYVNIEDLTTELPRGENVKDVLFNVSLFDPQEVKIALSQIILQDYSWRLELKQNGLPIPYHSLYIIEEVQDVLGTMALRDAASRFLLKAVSEMGNFKMSAILIGQRLADVATPVIERSKMYLFLGATGDNDLRKIKSIAGASVAEKVKMLKTGESILYNGEETYYIKFPLFVANGKPQPLEEKKNFIIKKLFGR